jgi:hypothetical protein
MLSSSALPTDAVQKLVQVHETPSHLMVEAPPWVGGKREKSNFTPAMTPGWLAKNGFWGGLV